MQAGRKAMVASEEATPRWLQDTAMLALGQPLQNCLQHPYSSPLFLKRNRRSDSEINTRYFTKDSAIKFLASKPIRIKISFLSITLRLNFRNHQSYQIILFQFKTGRPFVAKIIKTAI